MAQLEVDEISLNFGGVRALDALTFDVEQGEICALIGPNGAGKTTMFNVISRVYRPTSGRLRFEGANLLGPREPDGRRPCRRKTVSEGNKAMFWNVRATDGFAAEGAQIVQWNGSGFDDVGEVVNLEGTTAAG